MSYRKLDDITDPWMGCSHVTLVGTGAASSRKEETCYWSVHASCNGFPHLTKEDVASMPDWYCAMHNSKLATVMADNQAPSRGKKKTLGMRKSKR